MNDVCSVAEKETDTTRTSESGKSQCFECRKIDFVENLQKNKVLVTHPYWPYPETRERRMHPECSEKFFKTHECPNCGHGPKKKTARKKKGK